MPRSFWLLVPVLCVALVPPSWSADEAKDPRVAEAEEAAKEEAALQAQGKIPDGGHETVLRGKYLQTAPQEGRDDIPGVFVVAGKAYQVKLALEGLRKQLAPFNGKQVTLGGKIRNRNKYFIVEEVLTQPGGAFTPAQAHTAPGRL